MYPRLLAGVAPASTGMETGQEGLDTRDWTRGTGQEGLDRRDRTRGTGHEGLDTRVCDLPLAPGGAGTI